MILTGEQVQGFAGPDTEGCTCETCRDIRMLLCMPVSGVAQ